MSFWNGIDISSCEGNCISLYLIKGSYQNKKKYDKNDKATPETDELNNDETLDENQFSKELEVSEDDSVESFKTKVFAHLLYVSNLVIYLIN